MRRVFLFLIFFFFILGGCAQNQQTSKSLNPGPDNSSWDFGKRQEGEILKHSFVLKNNSGETLNIKDINTSCGCTASQVQKKILSPGETTLIEVTFNTKGYSGPVQQFIYVNTDSPKEPILRFIIKAEIKMKPKLTER